MKGRKRRELKTLEAIREWKEVSLFQKKWMNRHSIKEEKEEWRERGSNLSYQFNEKREKEGRKEKEWLKGSQSQRKVKKIKESTIKQGWKREWRDRDLRDMRKREWS